MTAGITFKSAQEFDAMRRAGRVVGRLLTYMRAQVTPGITTRELDALAERFILDQGATPAFKGLYGYPYTICLSVNEEVVHGLPNRRKLKAGDIIGIDTGAIVDGFNADAAITVPVGELTDPTVRKLVQVTRESLWKGIEQVQAGNRIGDVGAAVQRHVETNGFSVVRDFVGHGIGRALHEAPQVPNYGEPGQGPELVPGMAIAIEPMVNVGGPEVKTLGNKWTVVTRDRAWSAHFEHSVILTEAGAEVITLEEADRAAGAPASSRVAAR